MPSLRVPRLGHWLAALGCAVLALIVALAVQQQMLARVRAGLEHDAAQLAEQVQGLSSDGHIMGGIVMLGLVDSVLKHLLHGRQQSQDAAVQAVLQALLDEYGASSAFVVDRKGAVVAVRGGDGTVRGLGRDVSSRPYFQQALAGRASLYPAIGRDTAQRDIFLAAPVRAQPKPQAMVVGVLVVHVDAGRLDQALARYPHAALLVSPQGLVFGGNRSQWLLHVLAPIGEPEHAAMVRDEQFGSTFDQRPPAVLPLANASGDARWGSRRTSLASEPLDWPDQRGPWRLVVLRERNAWENGGLALAAGLLTFASGAAVALLLLRRQARRARREQERRASEAAVARELAFQQHLIDALPNPLFVKDVHGRYLRLNQAFERAYGVTRDKLIGRTVLDLTVLDPATRQAAHDCDMALVANGGRQQRDFDNHWADGRLHQTMYWGQGLRGADGAPSGMVGVLLDVSEQAEVRADLRAREQQLLSLLESTPGTVVVTNDKGQVLFHNRNALEMFRIDAEVLATQGVRARYVDPAMRPMLLERLQRDGYVRGAEAEMVRGDGSHLWTQITLSRGDFGAVRNVIFAWSMDITERRQAADAMRAAKEAAEAATAAKSAFLANMSHEIRTPMNAIIGLAHLALQTRLSDQQRDYVQKVHNAARALLGIVNDILDFSKIEAGKLEIEHADFDLDRLFGQLATLTGEKAGARGLELVFDIGEQVPRRLRGDMLRLGQVMTNLVTNAVKFTEQGEVTLRCRHRPGADGTVVLLLSVSDTGIGMTPEQMTRMFAPFSQADESTTRRFGGTGLGLSICKRLVDAVGGRIGVDSVPEQGSRFDVEWPCQLDTGAVAAAALPERLRRQRALVVEAHARAGKVLAGLLLRLGLAAADVQAGQDLPDPEPHDLLLVDIPTLGADPLLRVRRLKSAHPGAALVLMGAQSEEALRRAAAHAGADGVLLKPVVEAALREALATLGAAAGMRRDHMAGAVPRLDGLRVLLVEDNAINQQIAVELMHAAGVAVDVAAHGRAALQRLNAVEAPAFDVVLMDLQMPVMDGHQAALEIRADARFDRLPIVAMTAHAMVEERQRCLDEGMNDHIAKPIDPALLYRKLAQWSGRVLDAKSQEPAALPEGCEGLPRLDGLDAQAGLRRTLGRQALYMQLLRRYAEEQRYVPARIAAAMARGEYGDAERLAHTLRGVSANLGADGVAAAAERLEQALHGGARQPDRQEQQRRLAELDAACSALMEPLREALQAQPGEDAGLPLDPDWSDAHAAAELERLCTMLAQMESEAADQLVAMDPWLRRQLTAGELDQLWRHVRRYDLDEALALLRAAPALARWREPARPTVAGAP